MGNDVDLDKKVTIVRFVTERAFVIDGAPFQTDVTEQEFMLTEGFGICTVQHTVRTPSGPFNSRPSTHPVKIEEARGLAAVYEMMGGGAEEWSDSIVFDERSVATFSDRTTIKITYKVMTLRQIVEYWAAVHIYVLSRQLIDHIVHAVTSDIRNRYRPY